MIIYCLPIESSSVDVLISTGLNPKGVHTIIKKKCAEWNWSKKGPSNAGTTLHESNSNMADKRRYFAAFVRELPEQSLY